MSKKFAIVFSLLAVFFFMAFCDDAEKSIRSIYIGTCKGVTVKEIIDTFKRYNANAVVIDVKDDWGQLFSDLPVQSDSKDVFLTDSSLKTLLNQLKEKKIYTIARVVTLKDLRRLDLCIKDENGGIWIDKEKKSWMDPSDKRVCKYLEDVCTAAVKIGFDEVQLDYIRFSSYFKRESRGIARINTINSLLDRLYTAVHKAGGKMSVCVFGCTIEGSVDTPDKQNRTKEVALILGQDFIEIAKRCDFICPMIYPSRNPLRNKTSRFRTL